MCHTTWQRGLGNAGGQALAGSLGQGVAQSPISQDVEMRCALVTRGTFVTGIAGTYSTVVFSFGSTCSDGNFFDAGAFGRPKACPCLHCMRPSLVVTPWLGHLERRATHAFEHGPMPWLRAASRDAQAHGPFACTHVPT